MIRNFLLKFILLATLIIGLQLTIAALTQIYDIPEIQHLDEMLLTDLDIVYFGDSTITNVADSDQNKQYISAMLQDKQPDLSIARVSHSAYHMDIYLEYARYIAAKENLPETVIIPINLRSFSLEWDVRPEYQFEKELTYLRNNNSIFVRSFYKPLSIFRFYKPEITRQEYESLPVYHGSDLVGSVEDFEKIFSEDPTSENVINSLVYFYLYELKDDHRKLQSMVKLAEIYRAQGINVIFYITPIDYQVGNYYLGEKFTEQVAKNVAVITETLQREDVILLDFSFSLTSDFFNWAKYPNEHLNEDGRNFIAQNLSDKLNTLQN